MFEALNAVLTAEDLVAPSLFNIAGAADDAGDEALEAAVEFGNFGSALDAVDDDAMALAVGAREAGDEVEDLGDEATQSAIQLEALDAAINSASRSSTRAEFAGLTGGLTQMAGLAATATPPVLGLASALGGLGIAGGTAGAGIAGIAFGGLQREAEQMAATSSEFEDSGEAMTEIFSQWGDAMKEATQPLQTIESTEMAMSGLEGMVELAEIGSESLAEMSDTLIPLAESFGATTLETAPEIFDELETTVTDLEPALSGLNRLIRATPDAISYFREQAVTLTPALGDLTWSAISSGAAFGELGTTVLTYALPALATALDLAGGVAATFNMLPGPLQAGALAFGTAAAGAYLWSGSAFTATLATQGLTAALATLTLPISTTALAIAALAGAVVGIISWLGLWDEITKAVAGTWNLFVEYIEFGINSMLTIANAIGNFLGPLTLLMGPIGWLIFAISHWGEIMNWVGGVTDWLGEKISDLAELASDVLGPVLDLINKTTDAVDDAGGVELDAVKAGTGGGDDGDDGSDGGGPPQPPGGSGGSGQPPAPPASTAGGSQTQNIDQSTNNFEVNVDGSGKSPDRIADEVVTRLEEKRQREDAHN